MQRIINDPSFVVEDYLKGFIKAHSDIVVSTANPRVLRYAGAPVPGKVGIVTGGGSGHKPAFTGYLGKNLVDAVAVGEIFSSPTARAFTDAIRQADSGQGVVVLYGNYAGDNMNVAMAMETAAEEGIRVMKVVANDDVPSASPDQLALRRGVAGEILMWKVGGARAAMGGSLEEVAAAARKAIEGTRSIGIGLTSCTIPAAGKPNFTIQSGMMEFGIGHHGEPGISVEPLVSAKEMAEKACKTILEDLPFSEGDRVVVLVSGLGATPVMELYIFYDAVEQILGSRGISVYRKYVGNYFTSLDMMGVTLTLMRTDEELRTCMDYEAYSVGLKQWRAE